MSGRSVSGYTVEYPDTGGTFCKSRLKLALSHLWNIVKYL